MTSILEKLQILVVLAYDQFIILTLVLKCCVITFMIMCYMIVYSTSMLKCPTIP